MADQMPSDEQVETLRSLLTLGSHTRPGSKVLQEEVPGGYRQQFTNCAIAWGDTAHYWERVEVCDIYFPVILISNLPLNGFFAYFDSIHIICDSKIDCLSR